MPALHASTAFLVGGMLTTGAANSLLSKWQDMQCVENCSAADLGAPVLFEQPVFQSLNMFAGEMLCLLPLLYSYLASPPAHAPATSKPRAARMMASLKRRLSPSSRTPSDYLPVGQDERLDQPLATRVDGDLVGEDISRHFGWRKWALFWVPAICDMSGTTLMNAGLILTPVSIYQMTRGSVVLFVGVLSVIFLRRHLHRYQWFSLLCVMIGVSLVGLSGSFKPSDAPEISAAEEGAAKVFIGILLILFAQLFTATQFVVEEKIMSRYEVDPLLAVGLEGTFGLFTTAVAMPILHFFFAAKYETFDLYRLWDQVNANRLVVLLSFAIMLSISSFNFFGLSVTKTLSATARSTIDTCRTLLIWLVSLSIGWETLSFPASLLQATGFAILVWQTLVFNGLLRPLFWAHVEGSVRLGEAEELEAERQRERERILEQTGELPVEGSLGRVGVDAVGDERR